MREANNVINSRNNENSSVTTMFLTKKMREKEEGSKWPDIISQSSLKEIENSNPI